MGSEQQPFDLSLLEQMSDKSFIKQVIDIYLQDASIDMVELKKAFTTGDLETVYKKAHKVKSSTGMLKANTLYNLLIEIEKTAKAGLDNNQLTGLIEQAGHSFNVLQAALLLHLQEIKLVAWSACWR